MQCIYSYKLGENVLLLTNTLHNDFYGWKRTKTSTLRHCADHATKPIFVGENGGWFFFTETFFNVPAYVKTIIGLNTGLTPKHNYVNQWWPGHR